MANQITDNRTILANADGITDGIAGSWTGTSSPTADAEIFIQGTGSIGEQFTNAVRTILWNRGTTLDLSGNHIYIWVNCGVVGRLETKALGGFRIRFCGPTATNFFEVYVGGNDDWPAATAGGWVMFVVDVDSAAAAPDATGGTPPATTAIQHIGVAGLTTAMTRTVDNTWVDAIWRLPANTPGIIVEGRNGGTTDWNSANIFTQLGQAAGTFLPGPGGSWVINTPIQFGINDTTVHGFTDTNAIWLWDDQEFAASTLYRISALGNAGGTTRVIFGTKTGSGDDATGAQGLTISAASTGVRWAMDFDDANLNDIGFYGCSFQHGGDFQLDSTAVQVISTLFIDCTSATISNSLQLRNSVVNPNTADGVAFMRTDDLTDIRFCSFQFSDGHAIELLTPRVATQISKGNLFTGFGATGTNDAAIYNNTGGAVTINVTTGGSTPTYRNGTGASTTVNNNVNVTLTGLKDNTEVRVYADDTTTELAGTENATDGSANNRSFSFALTAGTIVDIRIFAIGYNPADLLNFTVPTSDASVPIQQVADRWYVNPP